MSRPAESMSGPRGFTVSSLNLPRRARPCWSFSSEHQELFGLGDRVLVMGEGELRGELAPPEYSEENLLSLAISRRAHQAQGGVLFGVPQPVILMFAVFIVGGVALNYTRFGRVITAIGSNDKAVRRSSGGAVLRRMLL